MIMEERILDHGAENEAEMNEDLFGEGEFSAINEEKNTLDETANLLYETAKDLPPEMVFSSLKAIYEKHEKALRIENSAITFSTFIQSFGEGLIKLVQQKLVEAGYNLGEDGWYRNGVNGKWDPATERALNDFLTGERAGNKELISPKSELQPKIQEIYAQNPTNFTVNNQRYYFGNDENGNLDWKQLENNFKRFIITEDPVKVPRNQPITFLGREIIGGVNAYMLPLLMAAEHEIREQGIKYQPATETIGGAEFRGMMIKGVESKDILSSHAGGLAIDIDAKNNGPHYDGGAANRGDIPDYVITTLVQNGFATGIVGGKGFKELGDDPMHIQLRFHPDSSAYQNIVASNSVSKEYYEAIIAKYPPLPDLREIDVIS